jgi:hypothetical protein
MMTFENSFAFDGSAEKLFNTAHAYLQPFGFEVSTRNGSSIHLTGPGLRSTRQNPILGATGIVIQVQERRIQIQAELRGVEALQKFVKFFPLFLGLGLGLFFGIGGGFLFGNQSGVGFGIPGVPHWKWFVASMGFSFIPISPWLVLSPMMSRRILRRTQEALNSFMETILAASHSG